MSSPAYNILPSPESVRGRFWPASPQLTVSQAPSIWPAFLSITAICFLFAVTGEHQKRYGDFLQSETTGNRWTNCRGSHHQRSPASCLWGAVWSAPVETLPALASPGSSHFFSLRHSFGFRGPWSTVRISSPLMRKRKISFSIGHSLSFLEGHPREKKSKLTAWLNPLVNRKPR